MRDLDHSVGADAADLRQAVMLLFRHTLQERPTLVAELPFVGLTPDETGIGMAA
ncbi:MAG: hypothetical protein AAGA32_21355 [Pseudomonadota bacterium]